MSGKNNGISKLQQVQQGFKDIQSSRIADLEKAEQTLRQELSGDGSMADYAEKQVQKAKELAGMNRIRYAPGQRDTRLFGDKY